MAKKGKEKRVKDANGIPMAQPDRSGPSEATLLQLAQERGLFKQAEQDPRNKNLPKGAVQIDKPSKEDSSDDEEDDDDEEVLSPTMDRIMDTLLWTVSLAMVHGTLDVLVQNQYAMKIQYPAIISRTLVAFLVLSFLFYNLHAHPTSPNLVPGLPLRFQHPIRQAIFFVASTWAGCHLIYITNKFSYLYILKQAPTLGCVWIWSVLELDLAVAVASLAAAGVYLVQGGYAIK
ncbi:hypothetical protein ColTof4_06381 [Colletotrichum tofieldiae]|uniref:DUF7719 domain-containing protein n=1 Tax=Colletotrichum tofieldiae TaxID=708197 RepID=A0A166TW39_9PEZI|nr:hypothetical protein CT0861_09388 [Colletotrichum tofieldiae]GKT54230.1 hypothetical protein ColTof3_01569 [Colletotrichum tofieldiae]GKT73958.1 hypothetical protein ColTof4_06381 [Colletotrichum tofieldiae]GKT95933.1 hypothetical protein Ct61P_13783 [Colletotrichum tofieldiae]